MKKTILIFLMFFLFSFVGCNNNEKDLLSKGNENLKETEVMNNRDKSSKREVTAVAIGDSITYGYPYTQEFSWVCLASQRLGIEIINKGEPGEMTGLMLARFDKDVVEYGPKYVIILGGTNDAFYGINSGYVRNNIYKMVEKAQQANIQPIIALPLPINEEPANSLLTEYRTWMKQFARERSYQIIDFYSLVVDPETGYIKQGFHEDGVHPNTLCYQAMSEIIELQ